MKMQNEQLKTFSRDSDAGCMPFLAFTLIELLVVIAVIGLLAGILLPVLSAVRQKAFQTQCLSNFRQIGVALNMYTDESNNWLPPGRFAEDILTTTQVYSLALSEAPVYSGTTQIQSYKKWLPYYLATFLSLPSPEQLGDQTNVVKVFICPAYVYSLPGNSMVGYQPSSDNYAHAFSYSVTRTNSYPNSKLPGYPFGKEGDSGPFNLNQISSVASPSEIWALADFDTNAIINPSLLGNGLKYMAEKPAHKDVRNFLFFDFHVALKKVTRPQNY